MAKKHRIVSETVLFKNYRTVVSRVVEQPSGQHVSFDIVLTPETVCCLPMTRDGRFILTRQFRPGPARELLVPPGGLVDPGEKPHEALARELLEETGYRGTPVHLASAFKSAYTTTWCHHYIVRDCEQVAPGPQDSDEILDVVFLSKQDLLVAMKQGEMTDLDTCLLALTALND